MEHIFRFIWAAICAWILVWFIGYIDAKTDFLEELFFPNVIDFIHGFGLSAKKVLFFALFLFLWLTGLHKYIGRGIFLLLGIIFWIIIIGLILLGGYWFLTWISGTL